MTRMATDKKNLVNQFCFHRRPYALSASLLALVVLDGCKSAVAYKSGTALDQADLVTMSDDMAAKIAADPEVNAAFAATGPLKVVVTPVVNNMRAEVLPSGQAELFTARVRVRLANLARDRFTFVMNRDAYYRLRDREIDRVDPGPNPDAVNPQYALTAIFSSLTEETKRRRDSSYVCTFELTNLQDRTVLWSGSYDVKKQAVREYLD